MFLLESEFVKRIWRKFWKARYYFKDKRDSIFVKPRKKLA
ncbi:hypothetical protein B481_2699 [Planococcus halocryophilus Or1]|nr:hypothetical protein B481_2699 [Planococcus halocryophilus Or1]